MEDKIKYKLIFCDLDQTLIVDEHIPAFNLEAIKQAKEKGVKFVINTARPFHLLNNYLKELNIENSEGEYTVCCNGSMIYENKSKKMIYYKELDYEILKVVFEYGKKMKDSVIMFNTLDMPYIFNEEAGKIERFKKLKHKVLKTLNDIKNKKIIRIVFLYPDYNYLLDIQNKLKNDKYLEGKISTSICVPLLEINSIGVCKGEALKWLSNYLNVDIKETIAIGDDYNDESMIKEAGLGCCVKNAKDDIKKISKYICKKDYFEGSVKEVIDKFILN